MGVATALYRRYRPESFAEVIGQDHVTTPLRRALRNGRIGHAYLFSGPRGCGKTTSARILARCLNCAEGPTDTPCGQCDSCRDLARGGAGSLDVVEIDAASHGGVDDARELRERASFAPVRDRYKVFIIDEAHMVTSAGFNALLKLVEEPPEHVKFVFATTEPDKVIGTIRSRTHHYPFRLIPPQVLTPYLEEVCAAEDVHVGEGVLPLVVRAGGGSARDTMSVLDQLMAGAGDDGLDHATAIALLGFTDTALLDQAVTAVSERDAASLYDAVEQVLATGHEPRRFVEDLLERMRDLIVLAAVPDRGADLLPQVPADELERMAAQASSFAPADRSRCGDLVFATLSTMSGAPSPRLHLELLAARLVLRDQAAAQAAPPVGGGRPGAAAPASGGGQSAPGGRGREEARRIAQERVEAARRARGGAPRPEERREERSAAPAGAPAGGPAAGAPAGEAPAAETSAAPVQPVAPSSAPPEDARPAAEELPRPDERPRQDDRSRSEQRPAAGRPENDGWGGAPSGGAPAEAPQGGSGSAGSDGGPAGAAPEGGASAAPGGGPSTAEMQSHWSAIMDELAQIRRPSWALVAQNAQLNALNGSTLVLGFRTDGLVAAFHRGTAAENLADAVRRIMHLEVTVQAVVGDDPGPAGSGPSGGAPGPQGGPGGRGGQNGPAGQNGPGGATGPGGQNGPGNQNGRGGAQPGGERPGYSGQGGPGAQDGRGGPGWSAGSQSAGGPQGANGPQGPAAEEQRPPRGGAVPWGDLAGGASTRPTGTEPAPVPQDEAAARSGAESDTAPATRGSASAGAAAGPDGASGPSGRGANAPSERGASFAARADELAARRAQRTDAAPGRGPAAPPEHDDVPPEPDDEYFPPEPDDGYPPDPREERHSPVTPLRAEPARGPASGGSSDRSSRPGRGGRWSDAISADSASTGGDGDAPSQQAGDQVSGAPGAGAATDAGTQDVPVVEDEGRDSVPEGEPRTYGQAAIRRAIAEGRVIRSRPAAHAAATADDEGDAPGQGPAEGAADDAAPLGPTGSTGPSDGETTAAPAAAAPRPWGDAVSTASTASAPSGTAQAPSAPVRTAPSSSAPTASAPAQPAPGMPAAPATGIALARQAAQASRAAAADRRSHPPRRQDEPAAPAVDEDPTGGASRDDEDAVVATRSGREVIETILGGRVLEVIDETGNGR